MTPQQQAWFDLNKIVIAAVIAFIFGMASNLIVYYTLNRERRLRMLEREGKRHKFWKDFFDAQQSLPTAARYSVSEIDEAVRICKTDLGRSYQEVMGHARLANSVAQFAATVATFGFLYVVVTHAPSFYTDLFTIPDKAPDKFQGTIMAFCIPIAVFYAHYQLLCKRRIPRDRLRSHQTFRDFRKGTLGGISAGSCSSSTK